MFTEGEVRQFQARLDPGSGYTTYVLLDGGAVIAYIQLTCPEIREKYGKAEIFGLYVHYSIAIARKGQILDDREQGHNYWTQ